MKSIALAGLLLVFLGRAGAEELSIRSSSLNQLRGSFGYGESPDNASPPSAMPQDAKAVGAVLEMEPVVVTESIGRRDLAKAIRDRAAAEAQRNFSWKTGGTIAEKKVGRMNADFGLWPKLNVTNDALSGQQNIMLRVDLLHLRW